MSAERGKPHIFELDVPENGEFVECIVSDLERNNELHKAHVLRACILLETL